MHASAKDRLIGASGSAVVIALLGYALLAGLAGGTTLLGEASPALLVLDLPLPKPPPPPRPVPRPQREPARGQPSPRNLENRATEIVAPKPVIVLAPPPPLIAAVKPREDTAASTGASTVAGPGEGAGGEGQGTGGGGAGDDDGYKPPRHIAGKLKIADLPAGLRDNGIGGTVFVRYYVETDGTVSDCDVVRSSGVAEIDRLTCQLIQQRFRFKPSRDPDGQPVGASIEESHSWQVPKPVGPDQRH